MPDRRVRAAAFGIASCLMAFAAASGAAQAPTAGLTGVVRDSAGHVLSGVDVRARNLSSGFTYRTSSSTAGRYWLRGLPPGSYDVTAERIGLRSMTVRGADLPVGQTVSLDFALSPRAVDVSPLDVRIETPLIETTKSEVSYVLDRERIESLPEETRNFIELARLVPGATAGTAVTGGPPAFGTRGSVVGALNQQSLGVLVDGGDLTEAHFGELGGSIPMLAIQEFEVLQGQYSAALGRAASGVVNLVTRHGGEELEFEGFGLFRHHALNARGAFESTKPDFDRSHWGVAAGGPLLSDRTRFFTAFERRAEHDYATVNTGGSFPDEEGTFETPLTDNLLFARIDHRLDDAHELTVRYAGEIGQRLEGIGGIAAPANGTNTRIRMHSGLLTHRWVPAGTWLNESRLHVIYTNRALEPNAPPGPTLAYPSLVTGPTQRHGFLRNLRIELQDDLTGIVTGRTGSHRLGVGFDLAWQQNETETFFFDRGYFRFATDTSTVPLQGMVTFADGAIRLDARNLQIGAYVEDDWTPAPGLTLNLGLRYDIETNGSGQGFVSPYAGDLPFIPTESRPIDADNLAPRIGVAWDPWGDGRTVFRAGFGVFYDALVSVPLLALEQSSGVRTARLFRPPTTDVDALAVDPDTLPPTIWTEGRIDTPRTRQYSLGVQRVLPGGVVARVDGMLIQGRHLLLQRELNPHPRSGPRYTEFASVLQLLSAGRATARMLLVELRKDLPRGWLAVAYALADRRDTNDTWGGGLVPQTDPDILDLDREWGPAAWDERHRLVVNGGVQLPFGLETAARVTYASARPFTAISGSDDNADGDPSNDRLPGDTRNSRRGPDFFRADLALRWEGLRWGSARIGLEANVYNLLNVTNGVPESVQRDVRSAELGRPREAFPGRQMELGLHLRWR